METKAIDPRIKNTKSQYHIYKPKANFMQRIYYKTYNKHIAQKFYFKERESKHPNYENNRIVSVYRTFY